MADSPHDAVADRLIFVYGTLMRSGCRAAALRDETFVGEAWTRPEYRLFDCGSYPGLVDAAEGVSIFGEVWRVSDKCLWRLDEIEGVDVGLYERRPIRLTSGESERIVEAYFYRGDVAKLSDVGPSWSHENDRQTVARDE